MLILPQQRHNIHHQSLISHRHTSPSYFLLTRTSVSCSLTTPTTTKKPIKYSQQQQQQLILNVNTEPSAQLLINSQADPAPKTKGLIPDPKDLQSTWSHRAWVTSGCTTVLISLANSVTGGLAAASISHSSWLTLLQPLLASFTGYLLADLGSGVYHWGVDNYGDASTPIFGSQIEAFQGHHQFPWIITRRQFANNLHALARAITFVVLPIDLVCGRDQPVVMAFVGACSGCIMFSQQFHAWAHGTKSKLPPLVVALQGAGILVSRSQHAAHHRQPYNNNYCIVSGVWNDFLDQHKVFETLEMLLFFKLGVRPRSWSDPDHAWTEQQQQQEDDHN